MARGVKTGGRRKGTPNKVTTVLKDAVLLAAEQVGHDGKGEGGLTGYLVHVAETDVKAFAGLLGRVIPVTVSGDAENPMVVRMEQDAELFTRRIAGLAARGGQDSGDKRTVN